MSILGFRLARYNKTKITKPVTTEVYNINQYTPIGPVIL